MDSPIRLGSKLDGSEFECPIRIGGSESESPIRIGESELESQIRMVEANPVEANWRAK